VNLPVLGLGKRHIACMHGFGRMLGLSRSIPPHTTTPSRVLAGLQQTDRGLRAYPRQFGDYLAALLASGKSRTSHIAKREARP